MIVGWYYLHTNGSMIFKQDMDGTAADLRESDFVKMMWPLDPTNRENAWSILIEASSFGADESRIAHLAGLWKCNDEDAEQYATRAAIKLGTDGNQKTACFADFSDLHSSIMGFGDNYLLAMADLCRQSDHKCQKMWGISFMEFGTRRLMSLNATTKKETDNG